MGFMEAFVSSTFSIAATEIGDKTQLLALLLASRFSQKNAVVAGIFMATLLNHILSTVLGIWLAQTLSPQTVKWIVGLSFIVMGLWLLLPGKINALNERWLKYGAFGATAILFFIAEIGDKTQVATIVMAVKYQEMFWVITGSVLGLLLANVPIVYFGEALIKRIPAQILRMGASAAFCILGVLTLLGGGIALQ